MTRFSKNNTGSKNVNDNNDNGNNKNSGDRDRYFSVFGKNNDGDESKKGGPDKDRTRKKSNNMDKEKKRERKRDGNRDGRDQQSKDSHNNGMYFSILYFNVNLYIFMYFLMIIEYLFAMYINVE